jgi:hypothetical protein
LSTSQPTAAPHAGSPNSRGPSSRGPNSRAPDARTSADEPAAEESLPAHAKRALRARVGAAATAVLDASIGSLQRLRTEIGGVQDAGGADEDDRRGSRQDGGRRDAWVPAAAAPAPRRRLRTFLVYASVLLAGGMGGVSLGYNLFSKLIDRQSAENRRLKTTLSKNSRSAVAAQIELEETQAKRIEAEKKLETTLAEYAKSSAENKKKLDEAENQLGMMLAASEHTSGARTPSPAGRGGTRSSAGGAALAAKTGNCKIDGNNPTALKDCILSFYR